MGHQLQRLRRFLLARLERGEFLGLYLTLALTVLVAGTWLFVEIAENVSTNDQITILDEQISGWLHAHQKTAITAFMLFISRVHSTVWVAFVTLVIIAWCYVRKLRYWALTLALSVYGGSLLNVILKLMFARARPTFENPIIVLTSYSFPSGHTMAATVLYGTFCAFVFSRSRRWLIRAVAVVVSLFMIALVAFSRIYLGAHYPSDVLGAFLEGLAWLTICLMGVNFIRIRRKSRKAERE